ncbi:MAG: S9 family peptidase, partial [Deltaproteobacteria bacterium]|nr:S9 family peptidase [Deltaproteobacteria bacterium]
RLMLASLTLEEGVCVNKDTQLIVGDTETAIFQPLFSPDGRHLAYVSNESGFSQLYLRELRSGTSRQLTTGEAEYGLPAWVQGMKTFGFSSDGQRLYALEHRNAQVRMMIIEIESGEVHAAPGLEEYTHLAALTPSETMPNQVAMVASSARVPPRVVLFEGNAGTQKGTQKTSVIRRSSSETLDPKGLSAPEPVSWHAQDGQEVYGLLYRPVESSYQGDGLPPAVVAIHGGPTGQAVDGYDPRTQFFTTRGYVYLQVNYRGSSGYGRAYQRALDGKWGLLDVEDALAAHTYLWQHKIADAQRIVIMGGSAGGYTVLATLVEHPGVFAAGLCLYGISNLFSLVADTHKFEAYYLDRLIGELPQDAETYRQRSPIFRAERIADPVAIFQGSEDTAVPPSQAEEIVASLRRRGVCHEYFLYEGEGHGWRRPETIIRHYHDVENFLRQVVIFK